MTTEILSDNDLDLVFREARINFLCAIGYGDKTAVQGEEKSFSFDEVCRIV